MSENQAMKNEVVKLAARAFLNVIEEHKIEPEETIDYLAMVSASMCDSFPNKREAIAVFLGTFAQSLHILSNKEDYAKNLEIVKDEPK